MVEPPDEELLICWQSRVETRRHDVSIICSLKPFRSHSRSRLSSKRKNSAELSIFVRSSRWMRSDFDSVAKTHRVVIVEQDQSVLRRGRRGFYRIQKNIFDALDAPIIRDTGKMFQSLQRAAGARCAAERGINSSLLEQVCYA